MQTHKEMFGEMVNEDYTPSDNEAEILSVMKNGRETGGPWGFATPRYLREETDIEKSTIEYCLRQLTTAGWIDKVTRGFYRFDTDPRENGSTHTNTNEQPNQSDTIGDD